LVEQGFSVGDVEDFDELMRLAALTVYKFDPLAYATTFPFATDSFSDADLEDITQAFVVDGDDDATNFLRGKLWADAMMGKEPKDAYARRGYEYLSRVSDAFAAQEPNHLKALAECCLVLDYEGYKRLVRRILDSREPEWRSHELITVLETIGRREDWDSYDSWRGEWDLLPVNAHACECALTNLYTYDGLRELDRGNLDAIPELLRKAIDVRGCPHHNTFGPTTDLAEALLQRRILLAEALAYVDKSQRFSPENERFQTLKLEIEAAMNS
jgi:hypothetical protein